MIVATQHDIDSLDLGWVVDIRLVSHVGQRDDQVAVHFLLEVFAHFVRVLDMVVVGQFSLCEFGQYADPVFSSDSVNADFHAGSFDDVVLFSEAEQFVGFGEADVAHQPGEVALAAQLNCLIMRVVELMVTKARDIDLELV